MFVKSLVVISSVVLWTGLASASESRSSRSVGGFVDLEWRVMSAFGRAFHGPGFAAGISLFGDTLRLGIAGFGRPGPWNPATFDHTLEGDTTYRGQRTVALRSDGGMFGPRVELAFAVPRVPQLAVSLPLTIGYGGFGFYLSGDDRKTPDGRRVSAWENQLFGERDSFLGLVVDGGVRVTWIPAEMPSLRPYVGAYVTVMPGYDTMVSDQPLTVAGAVGFEIAR